MPTTVTLAKLEAVTQLAAEVDQKLALKADASALALKADTAALALKADASDLAAKVSTTDPRLSDARTPLAHSQAMDTITGLTDALAQKVGTADPRLTDSRTPTAHTHAISDVTGLEAALGSAGSSGGGAGATAKLVASGAIPGANAVAALNSDGTVSVVTGRNQAVGTQLTVYSIPPCAACYHAASGHALVAFIQRYSADNGYDKVRVVAYVGSVSGTTISWAGSTTVGVGDDYYTSDGYDIRMFYHPASNRVLIASLISTDVDNGYGGYKTMYCIKGTLLNVSGATIEHVKTTLIAGFTTAPRGLGDFCEGGGAVVFSHYLPTYTGCLTPLTISASSFTVGTTVTFSDMMEAPRLAWDSTLSRFVAAYYSSTDYNLRVGILTTSLTRSGNVPIFDPPVNGGGTGSLVRLPNGRMLVSFNYSETTSPVLIKSAVLVFTPTLSGVTDIGTTVTTSTLSVEPLFVARAIYDSAAGRVVVVSPTSPTVTQMQTASVSGNIVTLLDTPIQVLSRWNNHFSWSSIYALTYLESLGLVLHAANSKVCCVQTGFTTASDRIGVFTESGTAGATVQVALPGSVAEGFTGLSPRLSYYVNNDGSVTNANLGSGRLLGYALSPTQLFLTFNTTGFPA